MDIEALRAETLGCAHVTHLNNAGSSLPPACVTDAVVDHLRLEERIGGYEAFSAESDRLEHTYDALARLVGARPDEIAVVENATRAWDMAFYAIGFRPGDRILTAQAEYASNAIAYLQVARRLGVRVDVVPDDEHGQLSVEAMRQMMDERVRLIAVTHVPTHNGLVNPAREIGRVASEWGVLYLLDACQSVGQLPLDVAEIGCHLLSGTGRKYLRGPRGSGFLYCSREILPTLEPPFLDLHAATWTGPEEYRIRPDARRFENWESYVAGRIGLGVAADYALGIGLHRIEERVTALADWLRDRLRTLPGVSVHDPGVRRCGIVTFSVNGWDSDDIAEMLAAERVNVSVTHRDSAVWDFERRGVPSAVRASVHYFNTDEEVERLCLLVPAPPPDSHQDPRSARP